MLSKRILSALAIGILGAATLGKLLSKALLGAVRDGGSRFQRSWGR